MAQEKELKPHEHTAETLASKFAKALLKVKAAPKSPRRKGKRKHFPA